MKKRSTLFSLTGSAQLTLLGQVRANQETRLKPYFAELETNIKEKLSIAEKRREEALGKVVDSAREEERKVEMVRRNKARLQVGDGH